MVESLFNKVADLQACSFIKNRLQHRAWSLQFRQTRDFTIVAFSWILQNFQENLLGKHLRTAASVRLHKRFWSNFKTILEGELRIFVIGLQIINFELESFELWLHKFDFYDIISQGLNVLRKLPVTYL